MAGKYSVIVTIIKSISIYFTTSTCKKMGFFFSMLFSLSLSLKSAFWTTRILFFMVPFLVGSLGARNQLLI